MARGQKLEDSVFLRIEGRGGAVDRIKQDDYLSGIVHGFAIDGVECCDLARLVVVEDGEVPRLEVGDGLSCGIGYLDVERHAMTGLKFTVAILLCPGFQRWSLGCEDLCGDDKDRQISCGYMSGLNTPHFATKPHVPTILGRSRDFMGSERDGFELSSVGHSSHGLARFSLAGTFEGGAGRDGCPESLSSSARP